MRVLSPSQGYALWAPTYGDTAVTVLEAAAVESLGIPLAGRRVLDVGCGNARRLASTREAGASVAVGVDLSPEMLLQARASCRSERRAAGPHDVIPSAARSARVPTKWAMRNRDRPDRGASAAQPPRNGKVAIPRLASVARNDGGEASLARNDGGEASLARNDRVLLAAADVLALPVTGGAFDVVWCRLVLGYVADLDAAYAELARCCALGGVLLVTDFHPAAADAGHRRTFRDAAGAVHELESHVHRAHAHHAAAAQVGLSLRAERDCTVGDTVRGFYAQAGRLDMYERQLGLPLVLALVFERTG